MATITPASEMLRDSDLLRSSPVQARSNARLTALLDAAATIIQRSGYEELTTAAVAQQAGASIGTVYRYFEDRIALLRALSTRNFERTHAEIRTLFASTKPTSLDAARVAAFDAYVSLFRSESGYRSLRLGDVLDIRPFDSVSASRRLIDSLEVELVAHYGVTITDSQKQQLETDFVIVDALLARAFAQSATGDDQFIAAARAVVTAAN